MSEKGKSFLRFWLKLFILIFIFLLGFGLAKRTIEGGISKNTIGVCEIKGIIKSAQPTLKHLVKFKKNKNIKAIILRIDSPGGAVGPSQEIYLEVMKLRKKKPVVASLGTIATSGGYYIASAANKIVAVPGTLTGSIGVKMEFANVRKLLEKLGIEPEVIKSGPYKDIGSPVREMTEEERTLLKRLVKNVHQQFIEAIAKGRNLPLERIKALADGSVFTGEEAKKLGLIDELGNFEDAIRLAAKLAGIKGEPKIYYPKEKSRLAKLFESLAQTFWENMYDIKFHYRW